MDKYNTYRPLLDLIGKSEGTDKGRGYNETLGYGAYTGGPVELVKLNLTQIDLLQTKMLNHPKNTLNSSALGRYQIIRTTLRTMKGQLKLDNKTLFDAETQDRLACYLFGKRWLDEYNRGELKEDQMLTNLAQEWASLPMPNGKGYYAGQRASVTTDEVRKVLREVKRRYNLKSDTPVKEKPSGSFIGDLIRAILAALFGGAKK
jgi:muramidase (phage lysozyme)